MSQRHVLYTCLIVLLASLLQAVPGEAQFMRQPSAESQRLAALVGEWEIDATMYFQGKEHRHTASAECFWVIDELWLQCNHQGKFPDGREIQMSEWLTWDETREQYTGYHIDPQLTRTIDRVGHAEDDGTLRFEASFVWRNGVTYYTREEMRIEDDGTIRREHLMATDPKKLEPNGIMVWRRVGK